MWGSDQRPLDTTWRWAALVVSVLLSCGVALHSARAEEEMSTDEIARKLANPVSNTWSLQLQNNMTFLRGSPSHSYRGLWTSNFQPVMPLHLTEDWNLIVRPVFNFTSTPTLD